jgi:hypothetical protein
MKQKVLYLLLLMIFVPLARSQSINATYSGLTTGFPGPVSYYFGFYDMGDHKNFELIIEPPGTGYGYVITDNLGVVFQIFGCTPSGGGSQGCSGQITLPRPVVSGVTKVSVFSGGVAPGEQKCGPYAPGGMLTCYSPPGNYQTQFSAQVYFTKQQ